MLVEGSANVLMASKSKQCVLPFRATVNQRNDLLCSQSCWRSRPTESTAEVESDRGTAKPAPEAGRLTM